MRTARILLAALCLGLLVPVLPAAGTDENAREDLAILRKYESAMNDAVKGLERLTAGDRKGALTRFRACLKIYPDHPDACYGRAVISSRDDDLVAALAWIERAEKSCRFLERIWKDRMSWRMSLSPQEQSRFHRLVTQGIDRTRNSVFCDTQSLIYNRTARPTEDLLRDGDAGESPFAVPAEFHALHGNILFKLHRLPGAEAQYLQALALNPAHERCLNNLINLYYLTGRLDRAREWLQRAGKQGVKVHPKLEAAVRSAP